MRFSLVLLALLGATAAKQNVDLKVLIEQDKLALKDQLMTMKKLAILADEEKGEAMLSVISNRKD